MSGDNKVQVKTILLDCLDVASICQPRKKTTLNERRLREWRQTLLNDPDIKWIAIIGNVKNTYPRWENVGLHLVSHQSGWASFYMIVLNREEKIIHIVDPTNAHFYEDPTKFSSCPSKRIWMDIAEEFKAKLKYIFSCLCPSNRDKDCSCYNGWEIVFFRCKELGRQITGGVRFPESTVKILLHDEERWDAAMIWYYRVKLVNHVEFRMKQDDADKKRVVLEARELEKVKVALARFYDELQGLGRKNQGKTGKNKERGILRIIQRGGGDNKLKEKFCNLCGKSEDTVELQMCEKCLVTFYCGEQCQAEDFLSHKEFCFPFPYSLNIEVPWYDQMDKMYDELMRPTFSKQFLEEMECNVVESKENWQKRQDTNEPLRSAVFMTEYGFTRCFVLFASRIRRLVVGEPPARPEPLKLKRQTQIWWQQSQSYLQL